MAPRSLTATLTIAFACTTLIAFLLVGGFVAWALGTELTKRDDLDIVLAARHARRLAAELDTLKGVTEHEERLESIVLGNALMSMRIVDADGRTLAEHNLFPDLAIPPDVAAASHAVASAGATIVPANARITEAAIIEWNDRNGIPVHAILAQAILRDGERATLLITRDMRDRMALLAYYRNILTIAGVLGVLLSAVLGYTLIRVALRPLREIAANAGEVTVKRLDRRMSAHRVPGELVDLVTSLNAMLARLETGFQHLSQFTSDLAHDMRTPLSNMRGATEIALARPRSATEYQALLESNLEECERLSRMIENVVFLARAEHPQFVRHMQPLDVRQELDRIAGYFEGLADEADVRIEVEGAGTLTADVELLRRAVSNLLANAIRHTPRGGVIAMNAQTLPSALRITVFNEGTPVAPQYLERIFDRFYRVDPSRNTSPPAHGLHASTGSAGLGLAIVHTIMELHGGTAEAIAEHGGMRFVLTFPTV
ncbi:MAG TPA: heavy metal sensor histidine kinase [Pararobbsia sp.]|nr:heavy metal sensor histidine kinase [Pararobbsia sp.]